MRTVISLSVFSMLLFWSSSIPVTARTSDEILAQGIRSFQSGNMSVATVAFEKALSKAETQTLANFWLGLMHYAEGERTTAKQRLALAYTAVEGNDADPSNLDSISLDFPSTVEARVVQRNDWTFHPTWTQQTQGSLRLQAGNRYSILVTPHQQREKARSIRWAGAALLLTWLLAR